MTIAERSLDGTSIGVVVWNGRVRVKFWAVVHEWVQRSDQLQWNGCEPGGADPDEIPPARREVKLWVSQNAGAVQDWID